MCGILAYFSKTKSLNLEEFINHLFNLKHRGQDSCGISYIQNGTIKTHYAESIDKLDSKINENNYSLLGHVRYITSGGSDIHQPYISSNNFGSYSLIFNGNIPTNEYDTNFNSDTLMIIDYLNKNSYNYTTWIELLKSFLNNYKKSYSLIIQTNESMFILRDKYGVRPLYYNKNLSNNSYLFSSETCIFDSSSFPREIKAGTLHALNRYGLKKIEEDPAPCQSHCLFEYVYFLNKNSEFEGTQVVNYRNKIGRVMAQNDKEFENNSELIVCGVPNSGLEYSKTYANELNITHQESIKKNKNVFRTFILKNDTERNKYAKLKYIFDENIKGKKIVIIDDSLVRGITLKNLVNNLKEFGVKEVHVRIASPPLTSPCKYGIDIPTREELIFNNIESSKKMCDFFNCESIKYISLNDIRKIMPLTEKCFECFSQQTLVNDW